MSRARGWEPPPVAQHDHVIDPPMRIGGIRCGRAHCVGCGYSLEFLLRNQPGCSIVRASAPRWTTWREPHGEAMPRG